MQYAGAVIASILKHASEDDLLTFYILQDGLNEEDRETVRKLNSLKPCKFEFITPDLTKLPKGKFLKYISQASLLRLQLPELLPELERIIYLDCDVIVMSSLKELWNTQTGDAVGAGAADYNSDLEEHQKSICCDGFTYINSGVFLFNLDLARKNNTVAAFFETAAELKERATLLDQDIINAALKGKIHILPLKWNLATGYFKRRYDVQYYSDEEIIEAVKSPGILHFSGKKKPWSWCRCRHAFWFEYFNAVKKTPWTGSYWRGVIKKILFPYRRSAGPAADAFEQR